MTLSITAKGESFVTFDTLFLGSDWHSKPCPCPEWRLGVLPLYSELAAVEESYPPFPVASLQQAIALVKV